MVAGNGENPGIEAFSRRTAMTRSSEHSDRDEERKLDQDGEADDRGSENCFAGVKGS